jgi:hypothetical protein
MEVGVPNSFIPHDATTPTATRHYESSGGLSDLLILVSVVLLVASVALGAGSFLYSQYLKSEAAQKQAQIQKVQEEFDATLISQLTTLDNRMNAAETILTNHIAPSAFFAALDETTIATISFTDLDFDASNPQAITLKMDGVASDINSIAYQADLFGKTDIITNAIFSGIDQQANGVHFTVTASLQPSAINYAGLVSGQAPSGVNQLPAATTSAVQSTQSTVVSPFTGAASGAGTAPSTAGGAVGAPAVTSASPTQ